MINVSPDLFLNDSFFTSFLAFLSLFVSFYKQLTCIHILLFIKHYSSFIFQNEVSFPCDFFNTSYIAFHFIFSILSFEGFSFHEIAYCSRDLTGVYLTSRARSRYLSHFIPKNHMRKTSALITCQIDVLRSPVLTSFC